MTSCHLAREVRGLQQAAHGRHVGKMHPHSTQEEHGTVHFNLPAATRTALTQRNEGPEGWARARYKNTDIYSKQVAKTYMAGLEGWSVCGPWEEMDSRERSNRFSLVERQWGTLSLEPERPLSISTLPLVSFSPWKIWTVHPWALYFPN